MSGLIRVGRCTYNRNGRRIDPTFDGFTPILVLTQSSEYGELGPYVLRDRLGRIMENVWQYAKLYRNIPEIRCTYSRYDPTIIWEHPAEVHVRDGTPTKEYWAWRVRGMTNGYAVRYPVGMNHRHQCLGVIASTPSGKTSDLLGYVDSRKAVYVPIYCKLAKQEKTFKELRERVRDGENLLIIEVDGPHEEALQYYRTTYEVDEGFIERDSMLITDENLQIMLNDTRFSFGHGYCLAAALLGKDKQITERVKWEGVDLDPFFL